MTLKEFLIKQNNLEDENLPLCYVIYDAERDEEIVMNVSGFAIQEFTSPFDRDVKRKVLFVVGDPLFEENIEEDDMDFEEFDDEEEEEPIDDGRTLLERARAEQAQQEANNISTPRLREPIIRTVGEAKWINYDEWKPTLRNGKSALEVAQDEVNHDALINWNRPPKDDIVDMLTKEPLTPKESVNPLTYEWNIFKSKQGGHVIKF